MKQESKRETKHGKSGAAEPASLPLCSEKEEKAWDDALEALHADWRANKLSYQQYSGKREALESARLCETVERARSRVDEYLDALLIIVGHHGNKALRFAEAFTLSKDSSFRGEIREVDTVENRAQLCRILEALAEIPREWGFIDLRRFFLGSGEQGKAKYKFPGRAMFKNDPEWSETEVSLVCEQLAGDKSLYAAILRVPHPVPPPEPEEPPESGEDFEIVPICDIEPGREECARKPYDKQFIRLLCERLEQRA